MALDRAVFDDVLKEDYLGPIRDQLNHKILLMHRIQRNTEDVEGKRAYIPLSTGRNEGIGSRPEGGTLPVAGSQSYDAATWNMTYYYGRIQVTGPVMSSAATDTGAFTRAMDSEIKGLVRDATHDLNRILYGNGNANLATGTTGTGTNTITGVNSQYLRVGQKVQVVVAAGTGFAAVNGGTSTSNLVISNIASPGTAAVVTLIADPAVPGGSNPNFNGSVAGTRIQRHGTFTPGGTPVSHDAFGLAAIVNNANNAAADGTGNFGNIDRTTATFWQGNVVDRNNQQLSLDFLETMQDTVDVRGDGMISIFIMDHALYRSYARLLTPDRRYPTADGKPILLDGGFKALEYDSIPLVKDKDCPANTIWGLDESTIMMFEMGDFDWMDKDGAILSRVPNQDAYEATLKKYWQMGCEDCANNIRAINVAS